MKISKHNKMLLLIVNSIAQHCRFGIDYISRQNRLGIENLLKNCIFQLYVVLSQDMFNQFSRFFLFYVARCLRKTQKYLRTRTNNRIQYNKSKLSKTYLKRNIAIKISFEPISLKILLQIADYISNLLQKESSRLDYWN